MAEIYKQDMSVLCDKTEQRIWENFRRAIHVRDEAIRRRRADILERAIEEVNHWQGCIARFAIDRVLIEAGSPANLVAFPTSADAFSRLSRISLEKAGECHGKR
jgi:hypothetical protein